ncbi:glycosyltransferase family 39 protein [Candidatus Parcubacteria bacterium]|nr:glycosyltransferase family 39 protein [Candidatus Parcubacteria bacterium]
MSNRLTNLLAVVLLAFMFLLAVFSMKDDAVTYDEAAHLPAGYSYLTQKDMRLNPEHPPLIKDLSALPLLFIKDINFPSDIDAWQKDANGQWVFGSHFLHQSSNPTDKMIFWGRIPIVLLLMLLGFYIFKWARELAGNKGGLLALFLFSFSPTFLAHGRLVTTDTGAAMAFFIATYYFVKSLQRPTKRNIVIAGIFFGLAQLCKFSLVLLLPLFGILLLIWAGANSKNFKIFSQRSIFSIGRTVLVGLIGLTLVWSVYQYHVWGYPPEKQVQDTRVLLESHPLQDVAWAADKPILRPMAQYLLGAIMVFQRASGGHTTFFLGEISDEGWKNYFPIVYAIKVPLAFHILTLIALLSVTLSIRRGSLQKTKEWVKAHFPELSMLIFIAIYWATSLSSNLNIGVRHLLPTFPFVIVLVSVVIAKLTKNIYANFALAGLIIWQAVSVVSVYPHFLAYFNESVGGPDKGYLYTVDSNLDWGQDLRRLVQWTDDKEINQIHLDYFGGSDAKYYLKDKYNPWWASRNPEELPPNSYLAVSATLLQGGHGSTPKNSGYLWLDQYEPVTKIGYSIFVYYIE